VVWVGVGAMETDGDIAVGGGFYLATGKSSGAVGIDQEGQKHGGRVLLVSGAAMVDVGAGGVDRLDGVDVKWTRCPGGTQSRRSGGRSIGVSRSIVTNLPISIYIARIRPDIMLSPIGC